MPKFDDITVNGAQIIGGDLTVYGALASSAGMKSDPTYGFQYNGTSPIRFYRVHQSACYAVGSGGAVVSQAYLGTGLPASIQLTSGTQYGFFLAHYRVPVGAQLLTAFYQIQSAAGASDTGKLDHYFYRLSAAATTQVNALTQAHTNNTPVWYGMNVSLLDARPRTDPSAAGDLEFYCSRLEVKYDTTLGGSQTHYLFGFALKYYVPTTGQLEEAT